MKRLWFDQHLHDEGSLRLLTDRVGRDRLVVGTNLAGWDAPSDRRDIVSDGDIEAAYDDNARRLLRLK